MKKFLLALFMLIASISYGQGISFYPPVDGRHYPMTDGRASVSFVEWAGPDYGVEYYYVKLIYPSGYSDGWEECDGSGGWVFTQPGRYILQPAMYAVINGQAGGQLNMYYGSSISIYVDAPPPPPPPLAVSISGPTSLGIDVNGTWTATASGGSPSYSYQWYYEYPSNGGAGPALSGNAIKPNLPPSGTWYSIGSDSPTLTTAFYATIYLECIVTDATKASASNSITVDIGSSSAVAEQNSSDATNKVLLKEELPTSYAMEQNYPNPFNPSTVINYQLPQAGFVTLKVYDILGNEVKTLVNEFKSAGKYSTNFGASNLASGIYIYQLKSGSYISIKKMILAK